MQKCMCVYICTSLCTSTPVASRLLTRVRRICVRYWYFFNFVFVAVIKMNNWEHFYNNYSTRDSVSAVFFSLRWEKISIYSTRHQNSTEQAGNYQDIEYLIFMISIGTLLYQSNPSSSLASLKSRVFSTSGHNHTEDLESHTHTPNYCIEPPLFTSCVNIRGLLILTK